MPSISTRRTVPHSGRQFAIGSRVQSRLQWLRSFGLFKEEVTMCEEGCFTSLFYGIGVT